MRIIDEVQLDFSDVLIQPKRSTLSSRKEVNIFRTFKWKDANGEQHQFKAIPCCAANMGTTGTLKMAEVLAKHGYMCALEKHFLPDELVAFYERMVADAAVDGCTSHEYTQRIFPTIGVNDHLGNFLALYEKDLLTGVVIDIANGYITKLVDKVKEVRKHFPDIFIVVGNVVTADITTDLILAGANCLKIGIGSGSACTTRLKTGVGRPQLSTVIECADAAHQLHAYVMSDGGCVNPCDINKAFCAGADFVMLGGMLAGCDEADGDLFEDLNGNKFKRYYGMSSKYAQEKHFGQFNKYRASEGREKLIPATGPLIDIIEDINGSIRSCCSYIGCHDIRHMAKHATFYRVNHQLNTVFADCKDFKS